MICECRQHSAESWAYSAPWRCSLANDFRPKKSGPDQRTPVIFRAISSKASGIVHRRSVKAIVQHRHTMSDSVPFPNQDGSCLQSSSSWLSQRTPLQPVPAPAIEQAASAVGLRPPIAFSCSRYPRKRLDQQVAANPARSIGSRTDRARFWSSSSGPEVPEIFDLCR